MQRQFVVCSAFLLACAAGVALLAQPQPPEEKTMLLDQVVDLAQREQTASPAIKQQLAILRQEIRAKRYTFEVGYTPALDVPLEELAGTKIPANLPELAATANRLGEQLLKIDDDQRAAISKTHPELFKPTLLVSPCDLISTPKTADWRTRGKVTPVRSQHSGTCWDYSAMGAYEGSYAIVNNQLVDTSEQYILSCCGSTCGQCTGGWWGPVFDYMISHGTASDATVPWTSCAAPCPLAAPHAFRAVAWGFVSSTGGIPTVLQTKRALCQHGPLTVGVLVTSSFQAYTGGVFNEHSTTHGINHGVTLIGWDDTKHAWLIKNSWGPSWGSNCGYGSPSQRGYMWITYDSDNIGTAAAWVRAQCKQPLCALSPGFAALLQREKIEFEPMPAPEPAPKPTTPR